MKKVIIVLALFAAYAFGQLQPRLTIEAQHGGSGSNDNDLFYFIEDKETGTRCYAVTKFYHEGTSINCVPKGK